MLRNLAVLLLMIVNLTCWAKDDNPAYTNAEDGGVEFQIQGEYLGDIDGESWGGHVIALGDGKFKVVGYQGGLPGDGWSRGDETRGGEGKLDGSKAVFHLDEVTLTVDGKTLEIESDGGNLASLKKVNRKSPTLGAKPPEGATILFDGSSVDAFENGKITEDKLLAATGVQSKATFGDHRLHLEFRTPFMPKSKGQARGNSGMYVQSRYEVQVLDSFGLDGKDNECGGIYSINEPIVNMCYPPLSWQTYDYEFTAARYDDAGKKTKNARITVKHNGTVIHDDLELIHGTPGRFAEGPEKQGLFLQDHGNPVVFRNIWVVEK